VSAACDDAVETASYKQSEKKQAMKMVGVKPSA
jgi:hypothetical protein